MLLFGNRVFADVIKLDRHMDLGWALRMSDLIKRREITQDATKEG